MGSGRLQCIVLTFKNAVFIVQSAVSSSVQIDCIVHLAVGTVCRKVQDGEGEGGGLTRETLPGGIYEPGVCREVLTLVHDGEGEGGYIPQGPLPGCIHESGVCRELFTEGQDGESEGGCLPGTAVFRTK